MGALNSSEKRDKLSQVNVSNMNGYFLGYLGRCSTGSSVDNLPSPAVSFANDRATCEMDKNPVDEMQELRSPGLPNCSSSSKSNDIPCSEDWYTNDMKLVPNSQSPQSYNMDDSWSTISHAVSNSSGTQQSYEPTPLTEVLPRLYLGSREDADDKEKITSLGITHIISVSRGERHKDLCAKYMNIPLRDNGSSDLLGNLKESYDFMVESQEQNNKLFIHCELGQNRSPAFAIGFLMRYEKWSLHEAYTFLKEKRELIHPHKKYMQQLRSLDKELHDVYSAPKSFLNLELCSEKGIKVRHHDFCREASHAYIQKQITPKVGKEALHTGSLLLWQEKDYGASYIIRLSEA